MQKCTLRLLGEWVCIILFPVFSVLGFPCGKLDWILVENVVDDVGEMGDGLCWIFNWCRWHENVGTKHLPKSEI
jgi:hypothetical protein